MKKTVVFDFDGVINSYVSGWLGVDNIPDPPVPGIKEEIDKIRGAGYEVVVVSTRCNSCIGELAVRDYLSIHNIIVDDVSNEKPPAICYIDDRAICFEGNADGLLNKIESFEPWHKRQLDKQSSESLSLSDVDHVIQTLKSHKQCLEISKGSAEDCIYKCSHGCAFLSNEQLTKDLGIAAHLLSRLSELLDKYGIE